ncbi:MAG: RDD family protein [Candidatus Limnocylindrales bacterium]
MPTWTANLTSTQPVAGPAGFFYADVPNRTIAYIIDVIIIAIINVLIAAIVGGLMGGIVNTNLGSGNFGQVNFGALLVVGVIGIVINAAYFVYTWTAMRGTVGMKLLGMQVGNEVDGSTLSMNQAIARWLLLGGIFSVAQLLNPIGGLGLLLGLLALIWVIVLLVTTAQSPTKQGLHDRYARTMVVKAARQVA